MMGGQHFWEEHEELPMGWMSRVSTKKMDCRGNFVRFFRAPEGTIFRSTISMMIFLGEQGRLEEIELLKNMRKRSISQVNTNTNPPSFVNRWTVRLTGAVGVQVVGIPRPAVPKPKS